MTTTTPAAAPLTAQRELHDCRDPHVARLLRLAEADPRIVAVVDDSVGSSMLGPFRTRFGNGLVDVGIAEQDMVGVAAGLADGGHVPDVPAVPCPGGPGAGR